MMPITAEHQPALSAIVERINAAHSSSEALEVPPNLWAAAQTEMRDWCYANNQPGPLIDPRFSERDARPHFLVRGVPVVASLPEG